MIEKEYKFILNEREYDIAKAYIFNHFENNTFYNLNYYLNIKNGFSARIRKVRKKYELTIKKRIFKYENGIYENEEINISLSETQFHNILHYGKIDLNEESRKKLNEIGISPLNTTFNVLGFLRTLRIEFEIQNFIGALDLNEYLGEKDYELEFKQKDPNKTLDKELEDLLEKIKIQPVFSKYSKFERFKNVFFSHEGLNKITVIIRNSMTRKIACFKHPNAGYQLPAGSVEYNESIIDGAIREAFEELGIDISRDKLSIIKSDTVQLADEKYILLNDVNVKIAPNDIAMNLGFLKRGRTVEVMQEKDDWVQIKYFEWNDLEKKDFVSGQLVGWVYKDNLSKKYRRHYVYCNTSSEIKQLTETDDHQFLPFWLDDVKLIIDEQKSDLMKLNFEKIFD